MPVSVAHRSHWAECSLNFVIDRLCMKLLWPPCVADADIIIFCVLASLLQQRRSPEANRTLHDVWPSPGLVLVHDIYIFGGSCPVTEFCPVQNSLYVQVLRSPILAALLHGSRAAVVSQTLRRGTGNGVTELSQRAPPIFGWAAITLGTGPHSNRICTGTVHHCGLRNVSEARATTERYINVEEYGNANASTLGPVPSFGAAF